MIEYIKGALVTKTPTFVIVEANNIGYHVNISLQTYAQIEKQEVVKLYIAEQIREDAHLLYGFFDEVERAFFLLLISVSGVGANTARLLLSAMTPDELRNAILREDVVTFSKAKGIGPKTAKRIIVELKDKVAKESGEIYTPTLMTMQNNTIYDEALSALQALGFNKIQIQKALSSIQKTNPGVDSVEVLIKQALRLLSV